MFSPVPPPFSLSRADAQSSRDRAELQCLARNEQHTAHSTEHGIAMRSAEWRLFLPNDSSRRHPAEVRTLVGMLEDVAPVRRTDVYVKADADVGVKRRVSATR